MTPLRRLFDEMIALAPEERERFLREHCVDTAMRLQLQRLLDADATRDEVANRGFVTLAQAIGDGAPDLDLPAGTRIGAFELVERLGEGGSSTVYRARRTLEGVTQEVALKILHRSVLSPLARRQFDRERRALAQLRHPNIARLIDGGVSDGGIAYLALELIAGRPLTEHAAAERLSVDARLRLFLATCRAVQSAHQALIVHRDLKPSNILVTAEGHVKLVDFGIAKWLHDEAWDDTASVHRSFTPAYSAPEQREGGAITTATDVYALGIVLGELLTGQRLNEGSGRTPSGAVSGEVAPGALPAPARALRRRLRGDLDNIVLKAIAAEPELRYASAGALAEDIERVLDGRPVQAHPRSRWYVLRKFVARHRGSVLVTLLLLLASVGSLGVAAWQGVVARREAAAARAEAARANAMRDFMFETFAEAEPGAPRSGPMTVLEAVERAARAVRADPRADPRARLELQLRLAEVARKQGAMDRAQAELADARAEAQRTLGPDDLLTMQIELETALTLKQRGEYAQARRLTDELLERVPQAAVETRIRLLRHSATLAARPEHDRERALRESDEALRLARVLGDPGILRTTLSQRGVVLVDLGENTAAVATLEEVLALTRERFGARHEQVALALAALSRARRRGGDLEGAERDARAAVAMDREIYAGDHWITSNHLNALALTLDLRGGLDEALRFAAEGMRISIATLGPTHAETLVTRRVHAMLLTRTGRLPEALAAWREIAAVDREQFGPQHILAGYSRTMYGYVLAQSGEPAAGVAEVEAAIAALHAVDPADADMHARLYERRAQLALQFEDAAEAAAWTTRLAEVAARLPVPTGYWWGRAETYQGEARLKGGDARGALALLERAGARIDASDYPGASLLATNRVLQASAAQALGDRAAAVRLAAEARSLLAPLAYPPPRILDLASQLPR